MIWSSFMMIRIFYTIRPSQIPTIGVSNYLCEKWHVKYNQRMFLCIPSVVIIKCIAFDIVTRGIVTMFARDKNWLSLTWWNKREKWPCHDGNNIFFFIQDIFHSNLSCHYHNKVLFIYIARRFMRIKNIKYHFIMLLKVFSSEHIRQNMTTV